MTTRMAPVAVRVTSGSNATAKLPVTSLITPRSAVAPGGADVSPGVGGRETDRGHAGRKPIARKRPERALEGVVPDQRQAEQDNGYGERLREHCRRETDRG